MNHYEREINMANKTDAVAKYIAKVANQAKTGVTTEHSFRPALAELLAELLPLMPVNEPKRQACGAPDFILLDEKNKLPVMFVETKDLGDDDLDGRKPNGNKKQFDRYKAALDTIVFTDFLDFHFYRHNGQSAGAVRIADWDGSKVTPKKENFAAFVKMMEEAASGKPQKIESAKRLAELMAGKARMLQRTAEAYLTPLAQTFDSASDKAKPAPTPLLDMMLGFRNVLMPDVGPEEFSDIFAQTLTYGMFAARLNDPVPETFSRYEAMGRIPKSNPFLKQLFQYVANNLEEELEWIVDDLADLFKSANVKEIMAGYGKSIGASDPMVHFYEDFLREYDAGLRKDRGVWYTPIQVVKFIVSAVDWALQKRFGLTDGLADSSMTQIEVEEVNMFSKKKLSHKVKKTVHRVQVLDPATGTGTFLAETVRQIREKYNGNEGLWPDYVEKNLLPRLNGFELLMASYTMAHVKLDFALRASGITPNDQDRFRVFLTDSLTEWHDEPPGGLFATALASEQQGADEVKRDTPVMVVMGNPPYNSSSANKNEWIQNLVADYKQNLNERKINLDDDYIKFIRLGQYYVDRNGSGILAYISNNSFLDGITHREMRRRLMGTFDEIYVLNLHGDARKEGNTPDGDKDENVFNIMPGVSITIFVKTGKIADSRVFYADLWGKRMEKFTFLETHTVENIQYQELFPQAPYFFFVPKDFSAMEEYNQGFSVAELMPVNNSGIQTKRDDFVYQFSFEIVDKIIGALKSEKNVEEIRKTFSVGNDGVAWSLETARQDILQNEGRVCEILYHPFDKRVTYFTGMTSGLMARPRMPASGHMLHDNLALLAVRNSRGALANNYFVADTIVDKDGISSLDNCRFFPLWLHEEKDGKIEKRANMDGAIVAKIGETIGGTASPEDIFAYIYGVLHTPQYRRKFKEFLKTDFPRIPYPKDAAQFKAVAEIGRALIDTHLMRDAAPTLSEAPRFPKMGNCRVDAVRFEADRVHINAEQYFDDVPKAAWEMPIGGYQPAQKWLKDRKGRTLSGDDIQHYRRIIIALLKTAEAEEKLEALAAGEQE
ncbi:MAG: N-6 DNA methylase [Lentisphaeria bacterium]|nr:N-6 DNA methylase [Lentisphaeria bacterium]